MKNDKKTMSTAAKKARTRKSSTSMKDVRTSRPAELAAKLRKSEPTRVRRPSMPIAMNDGPIDEPPTLPPG